MIVAEAAIKSAEDRLRALIFDPASPDFWTITIEPSDDAPFQAQVIDTDAAVRRALDIRTDLRQAKNGLEQNDVTIRYLKNQLMPDVNANLLYRGTGTGGSRYQTDIGAALEGRPPAAAGERARLQQRDGRRLRRGVPDVDLRCAGGLSDRTERAGSAGPRAAAISQAQTQMRNLELGVATGPRGRAHRPDQPEACRQHARGPRTGRAPARSGREVRRRHRDELLRVPGAAISPRPAPPKCARSPTTTSRWSTSRRSRSPARQRRRRHTAVAAGASVIPGVR